MFTYQSLVNVSNQEIMTCLNDAFKDYYVPIKFNDEQQLLAFFRANNVSKELSYGAFINNKLIGIIINAFGIYNNEKVVFDAGTGVVKEYRGKQVFTNLFDYMIKELNKLDISSYYLEVLTQNQKAINAYLNKGFVVNRKMAVLILKDGKYQDISNVEYQSLSDFNFDDDNVSYVINPSFENSSYIINQNHTLYSIAYIKDNNQITDFCIFSNDGNIIQIGYSNINNIKIIMQNLINKYQNLVVKNIDVKYNELLIMLSELGFNQAATQYEMVKKIK